MIAIPFPEDRTAAVSARSPHRHTIVSETAFIAARIFLPLFRVHDFIQLTTGFRGERFIAFVLSSFAREFRAAEICLVLALFISLVLFHQNTQRVLVIDRAHGIVQFLVVLLLHRRNLF